jgi:hypothetical protein
MRLRLVALPRCPATRHRPLSGADMNEQRAPEIVRWQPQIESLPAYNSIANDRNPLNNPPEELSRMKWM